MTILLIADHDSTHINDATLRALSAAQQIGADITILVAGHGCVKAAENAAKFQGVGKVYWLMMQALLICWQNLWRRL